MKLATVLVASLLVSSVSVPAGAHVPFTRMVEREAVHERVVTPLLVGAGLFGVTAGAVMAIVATLGSGTQQTASVAVHRPGRPSPERPAITADVIAALYPPHGDVVANGTSHHA